MKVWTDYHERRDLADVDADIALVGRIRRTVQGGQPAEFFCYRFSGDAEATFDKTDPFPTPKNRSEKTTGRGRFRIMIHPSC